MTTVTSTSKGQVTIPKDLRSRLVIDTGERVEFVEIQDGAFHIVAATQDVRALKGIVTKPENPGTIKEMNQAIAERGGTDCLGSIPTS